MLLYHFPNPARAVQSLKEVIVLLVLQLLPVKVSLHEGRQRSDLGFGGISNVTKAIIDSEYDRRLGLGGEPSSGDLHGFL